MLHSSSTGASEVLTSTHNAPPLPRVKSAMENSTTQSAAAAATESSDRDRGSIYTHPLFPLMALLFEKCEQATQSPDPPTSDSFDVDIEEFVDRQKREGKAFFCDDTEVDNLMIKAIQVLRIHLLELEKVNELCQDFCHRYITCLKGKMHSENLLKEERSSSTPLEDTTVSTQSINDQLQNTSIPMEAQFSQAQYQTAIMNTSGQVIYAPVYPPGLVAQPLPGAVQLQAAAAAANPHGQMVIHGSTPLSQIGLAQQAAAVTTAQGGGVSLHGGHLSLGVGDTAEVNDLLNKRKPKRGVLPKQATNVMRSWLFQHIVHPYPTEDEKRMIAAQTNLTLLQVNNWFINARRRILQPMLDASNPEAAKTKKQKTTNRPSTQRFWPQSLATLGQSPLTAHHSPAGVANKMGREGSNSESGPVSPELPELRPPHNPMSPSSIMNNSSAAGSPRMVKVDGGSESDSESGDHNFQPS